MELTLFQLNQALKAAAQAGAEMALDSVGYKRDLIRYSEAEKYMKSRGLKPCTLKKMKDEGLLVFRKGEARNSPLMCRKSDLIAAVAALQVKSITF